MKKWTDTVMKKLGVEEKKAFKGRAHKLGGAEVSTSSQQVWCYSQYKRIMLIIRSRVEWGVGNDSVFGEGPTTTSTTTTGSSQSSFQDGGIGSYEYTINRRCGMRVCHASYCRR